MLEFVNGVHSISLLDQSGRRSGRIGWIDIVAVYLSSQPPGQDEPGNDRCNSSDCCWERSHVPVGHRHTVCVSIKAFQHVRLDTNLTNS